MYSNDDLPDATAFIAAIRSIRDQITCEPTSTGDDDANADDRCSNPPA